LGWCGRGRGLLTRPPGAPQHIHNVQVTVEATEDFDLPCAAGQAWAFPPFFLFFCFVLFMFDHHAPPLAAPRLTPAMRVHHHSDMEGKVRAAAAAAAASLQKPVDKEKYGLADTVLDGMTVTVNVVSATLTSRHVNGTVDITKIDLRSVTPAYTQTNDLKDTATHDTARGTITLYKRLSIESIAFTMHPTSTMVSDAAKYDPLRFKIETPAVHVCRRKSLLDNTQVGRGDASASRHPLSLSLLRLTRRGRPSPWT
jgi:hypothetical protein